MVVAVWKLKRFSLGNQVRTGMSSGRGKQVVTRGPGVPEACAPTCRRRCASGSASRGEAPGSPRPPQGGGSRHRAAAAQGFPTLCAWLSLRLPVVERCPCLQGAGRRDSLCLPLGRRRRDNSYSLSCSPDLPSPGPLQEGKVEALSEHRLPCWVGAAPSQDPYSS